MPTLSRAMFSRQGDGRQSTSRIKARADSLHLEAADPHRRKSKDNFLVRKYLICHL
jgi:hypothetical protein